MTKRIKIGIIPAAGEGTRLGYLSNLLPKTLFPIYDRPILHHIIDIMESLGIEDIYIIVNVHKEKIRNTKKIKNRILNQNFIFFNQKKSIAAEAVVKEEDKDSLRQTCSANVDKD